MFKIMQKILFIVPALTVAIISTADADPSRANRAGTPAQAGNRATYMIGTSASAPIAVPVIAAPATARAADNLPLARAADDINVGGTTPGAISANDEADAAARAAAEAEKTKCLANNVGMGGVFVWASKNARNSPDYMTNGVSNIGMLREDTTDPTNNTCFVRIELSSSQSGVNMSGIPYAYFAENDSVTCGSWASKKDVENKILAASSTSRTLGTIGGALGGAAIGFMGTDLLMANTAGKSADSAWHHQGHMVDAGDNVALMCSNLKGNPAAAADFKKNIEACANNTHKDCEAWRGTGEYFKVWDCFNNKPAV